MTNYSAMAFPKKSWKIEQKPNTQKKGKKTPKKRKRHGKSILQDKSDKRCYLCMLLNDDYREHTYVEEHHIMFGSGLRALSEEHGLKVNLCLNHHRNGPAAVHNNSENAKILMREAQERFREVHPDLDFQKIFGKNYL